MTRKKRKYTRKKKLNVSIYIKKLLKVIFFIFILHFLYINTIIHFSRISYGDTILITGDNKQNSKNISDNLEKKINTSIELFQENTAKKIYVLWEINQYKIDEVSLITQYIWEKDIWQWNIAYKNSTYESYPKNVKLFLQENQWDSIILVSSFWDYYKNIYFYSQRIETDNIKIKIIYTGALDIFIWSMKNYYYFWKI